MKILKFGAIWCKDCLVMKSKWEEIENEMKLKTEYYDADDNPEILEKYNVKDVPVFIFLDKNSNEILRLMGVQNKEDLIEKIKENSDK
ncbi:MAG: thioredoxin family protein [bacterium]